MEKQVESRRMEDLDACYFDSSKPLSLNAAKVEFDASQLLSLNSTRQDFDSGETLGFNSTRHEPLSLNSMRHEFDSVEPPSLEYEYEIEGLGRPQQQEHCTRWLLI